MPLIYQQLINQALADGIITFKQYRQIPWKERDSMEYLFSPDGRQAIAEGVITLAQYLRIPSDERQSVMITLQNPDTRRAITDGIITLAQYLQIPSNARWDMEYLFSPNGRQAMADGIITLAQYLQIPLNNRQAVMIALQDPNMRIALQDPDIQQIIINGRMTIEGIIAWIPIFHHAIAVAVAEPNFNGTQSTHTASVHQTVSESATRLVKSYQLTINDTGLETIIRNIRAYIDNLPDGSKKNTAAKRGLSRITHPNYSFTEHKSTVTIKQLLALVFLAIHDNKKRVDNLEDAKPQLVEALYEIQRGGNLSETGKDDGKEDNPICAAGAFNKLIEKLHGIHSDCQILYTSRTTASFKLPIVVREEAMLHLATFDNPHEVEQQLRFTPLMAKVKKDGLETTIWVHIKDNVATRMFGEFGSLYKNITDSEFTDLVEAGKYVDLDSLLSTFQKLDLQLGELENKGKNLNDRAHTLASDKVSDIVRLLCELNYEYFTKTGIDYLTYKARSLDIIKQERPELDKHRGYKQILGNLPILIATLGTAQLLNKTCFGGNFLFFKTDSSTYIDQLSNVIEEIELNRLSNRLS